MGGMATHFAAPASRPPTSAALATPAAAPMRRVSAATRSPMFQQGRPRVRLSTGARNSTPDSMTGLSGGEPLSPTIQRQLENSFQVNLQSVRVRTDAHAQSAARGLLARAFTYGNQIF